MFNNIKNQVKKSYKKELAEKLEALKAVSTIEELQQRYYLQYLTPKLRKAVEAVDVKERKKELENCPNLDFETWQYMAVESNKKVIAEKMKKEIENEIEQDIERIDSVAAAPDVVSFSVCIEWTKSRTWGYNPKAKLEIKTTERFERFETSRVIGCGYDKQSAAFANAANQSLSIKKVLYKIKNKAVNKNKSIHDALGYGLGYGELPYFESGVGCDCFTRFFKDNGFRVEEAHGDSFDWYYIEK